MPADRSAKTYVKVKLLRGGGEEKVTMCIRDNVELVKGVWTENRGGILYKTWGFKCPECGTIIDTHSELIGPA